MEVQVFSRAIYPVASASQKTLLLHFRSVDNSKGSALWKPVGDALDSAELGAADGFADSRNEGLTGYGF